MSLEDLDAGAPAPVTDSAPPVVDTPSTPDPKPDAAPADTLDDDLRKVWRNSTIQRSEDGKFASKDGKPSEQPAPAANAEPEAQQDAKAAEQPKEPEAPKPVVEPPRGWKDEHKAKFATLDPELQKLVSTRETELHEAKSQLGRYQPIGQVISKHAGYLDQVAQATGKNLPTYLNDLISYSAALDAKPAETIKALANMYGVDLGELYDPLAPTPDPAVTALQREVQELRAERQREQAERAAWEQETRAAQQAKLVSEVDKFFSETPDAAGLEPEIEVQISALRKAEPNADPKTLLAKAYERAVWANPERRAAKLKAEQEAAEKSRIEAAQKAVTTAKNAARVNVNGSPRQGASTPDLDTDLRSIWRRNASR
jgi:hypothetical protein